MKTVTLDDDSQNIYTVPVVRCNQQTSVEESKYEEKGNNTLIFSGEYISKKEPSKITERKQCAYTLLLVQLHYSINKAITICVFYCT